MLLDSLCVVLIFYGDCGLISFRFIGFKSLIDFDRFVDNVLYIGGERRIDKVVEMVIWFLNEVRLVFLKVVIFFIGGR